MPRIRSIKPEFPQSESMGRVSRDARLLFVNLWTISDDEGRTRGNSRMLASLLYPYDDDAKGLIESWMVELEREGCIARYVVKGASYLQVLNWLTHQKIDKPSPSKLPQFDDSSRSLANVREASTTDQDQDMDQEGKGSAAAREAAEAVQPTPEEFLSAWNKSVPFCPLEAMPKPWCEALAERRADPAWRQAWRRALAKIRGSPFLSGGGEKGWKANPKWFLQATSVTRILAGEYDEIRRRNHSARSSSRPLSGIEADPEKYDDFPTFGQGRGGKSNDPAARQPDVGGHDAAVP